MNISVRDSRLSPRSRRELRFSGILDKGISDTHYAVVRMSAVLMNVSVYSCHKKWLATVEILMSNFFFDYTSLKQHCCRITK